MKKSILLILILLSFGCAKHPNNIGVFGDSLSADTRWIYYVTNNNHVHMKTYGLKGATIYDTSMQICTELGNTNNKFDAIIVWSGVNDIAKGFSIEKTQHCFFALTRILSDERFKFDVYFILVPNCIHYKLYDEEWEFKRWTINLFFKWSKEINKRFKTIELPNCLWTNSYKYTDDGLHLNSLGNKIAGQYISNSIFKKGEIDGIE